MAEQTHGDGIKILVFEVAGLSAALLLESIHRVERAVAVSPLPRAPSGVEGVFDLGGKLVPVLALRERLRLPSKRPDIHEHFIIVRVGDGHVAFRVDAATRIEELNASVVDDVQTWAPDAPHLIGVARLDTGLLFIHDPTLFLSVDENIELAAAVTSAAVSH